VLCSWALAFLEVRPDDDEVSADDYDTSTTTTEPPT
jgi:hypothetical protein